MSFAQSDALAAVLQVGAALDARETAEALSVVDLLQRLLV